MCEGLCARYRRPSPRIQWRRSPLRSMTSRKGLITADCKAAEEQDDPQGVSYRRGTVVIQVLLIHIVPKFAATPRRRFASSGRPFLARNTRGPMAESIYKQRPRKSRGRHRVKTGQSTADIWIACKSPTVQAPRTDLRAAERRHIFAQHIRLVPPSTPLRWAECSVAEVGKAMGGR